MERVSLTFVSSEGSERVVSLGALLSACGEEQVEVDDPYHGRPMRYAAIDFVCVLEQGFGDIGGSAKLRDRGLLLRALDGYTRPVAGRDLLEPGGYLAFGEPDRVESGSWVGQFTPIDRNAADPAPFYLVWNGHGQNDPHDRPWPYQLSRIEIASFDEAFPHTVPKGLATDDAGWQGYAIFERACASCHSINGEGGKIGPDLNVPRSIVEYRPVEQIRGYIRNPRATRYTSMPSHGDLSEAELDALLAYFRAMSERKFDPRSKAGSG